MAQVRKTTPTAGLEIVTNIIPLDIFIQGTIISTYKRLNISTSNKWKSKYKNIGHLNYAFSLISQTDLPVLESDRTSIIYWEKQFSINIESFLLGDNNTDTTKTSIYTDGSKNHFKQEPVLLLLTTTIIGMK